MSAATAAQQQSSSLNTPGFFASAFMEMNIFEQCFSAAAPSDPKNNASSSGSINTVSSSPQTAASTQTAPSSSRGLNPITQASASHVPPPSPKSATMDGYNPSDFPLPTIFSGVEATGPSHDDIERRYGQNRWPVHLDTTAVPPSAIQPHLSPPYSPRSPTDRFMPPVEMDDTMSPLHNMLVNYPTETRSAHGQITPPEDPPPLTQRQQGGRMFDDNDDNDCFNDEYAIIADTNHSSSSGNQELAEAGGNTSSCGSAGAAGRSRTRTNNRGSTNRRSRRTGVEDDSAKEAKRQKFLERNRIAASKCRRKKKQWTQNLEDTAREVQATSKHLNGVVAALRDQLLHLKGELLKHNGCSCERIKQYLMNEATRVVEGSSASASAGNAAAAANSSSSNNAFHQASRQRQMSQGSDLGFSAQFDELSDTSSARFAMDSRSPEDTGVGMPM
ncbi:unnamed protein product [Tuber melanosporum]|uniref:(Perigord truffle) hypothetical protein n=1 Tax=Tuber melanosporum (strain Mel28) TaxID=656061 RepID=D5GGY5_TUBMM|nr:uncharacterized protein GSTUM_00007619001 [Tuber melanosporum]CAZ83778.1 unnamed protein product [Tuber melanosporum]